MNITDHEQASIIRTERGLTISDSRITIYDVIDFLRADYAPELIRDRLNLTDAQINAAMSYIENNRDRVENEYRQVLQTREEIRQYWEERNREHFDRVAKMPRKPGQEALRAKLEEQKAKRGAEKS